MDNRQGTHLELTPRIKQCKKNMNSVHTYSSYIPLLLVHSISPPPPSNHGSPPLCNYLFWPTSTTEMEEEVKKKQNDAQQTGKGAQNGPSVESSTYICSQDSLKKTPPHGGAGGSSSLPTLTPSLNYQPGLTDQPNLYYSREQL